MRLEVKDIAGKNCITQEDGNALYQKIHPELKAGRPVELSFKEVRVFASPFFNAGVGQLLRDIPASVLNQLLKVTDLPPNGIETLKKVIENSRQFYSDEKNQRAVAESLKQEE
ncbi:MAG TPA: STAS-like domain-containing protein [Candidatus Angelobacter sp.]|nr:STAS-like domain-containing protein [Candidatus Angelobacter sp.]